MAPGRVSNSVKAKKSREAKPKVIGQETLTDEKWENLKPYGSFVVPDPEGGEGHKFMKDEIAAILPHNSSPGTDMDDPDYWIGKIKDIRAELHEDETNTVWIRVQWFYSGKDVSDVVKSFDVSAVGKYERIFSDHFDVVGPECFNAVIPMIKFNENDPEPPFVAWDRFFRRYTFEYKTRSLKPKPGTSSCTCKLPYNPNDTDPSSIMHFCPRPSCRKAYHHRCLLAAKSKESSITPLKASSSKSASDIIVSNPPQRKHARATRSGDTDKLLTKMKKEPDHEPTLEPENPTFSRSFRLLACSPDTDDNVDLASLISSAASPSKNKDEAEESDTVISQPPKKKPRGRPSAGKKAQPAKTRQSKVKPSRSLADALGEIPLELLHVAEQPLIRGGAFRNGGVSGNIAFVTRARRLVYQLLQGIPLPENWEDVVFGEGGEANITNAIVKIGSSKKTLPPFVCPHCRSAI